MMQVEELYRVRGFDAAAVAKLRPYVSALPASTRLNVNTAPEAVLLAVLPGLAEPIKELARDRTNKPLQNMDDIKRWARGTLAAGDESRLDVASDYFYVRVQVAQDDVELSTDALIQRVRAGGTPPAILWQRPRY
jgi:general secretion pathway protein K